MEHKFTIEVILKYDGPKEKAKELPIPNFQNAQALQIDPNVLKGILGQIGPLLGGLQQKPQEKPKNSDDKK